MGSDKLFQKKKFRREKELARKKANKEPYETLLIVCEDSKSSPNYFKEIIRHYKLNTANVNIQPSKGSAPISVVEHALEFSRTTPDLGLLLHFIYTTKSYRNTGNKSAAEMLIKDLEKALPNYNKGTTVWFKELLPKLNTAIQHAKRLEKHNQSSNSSNPSTNIYELAEYLISLKEK